MNNETELVQDGGSLLDEGEGVQDRDLGILQSTLGLYGTISLGVFMVFCCARKRFPRVYNLRNWVDEWKTPLAESQHGFFNWAWRLSWISDEDFMDGCGLDALCFMRVLHFGFKISLFGMMNAIWLMPVYVTAEESDETEMITDPIVLITTAHLSPRSHRFMATMVASYMLFGYTMFLILKEFSWFYEHRHRYLTLPMARNYAVSVRNIPEEYTSKENLLEFFYETVAGESILDVHVLIKTPHLKSRVARRKSVVQQLEHAINVEEITGSVPMRWSKEEMRVVNAIESLYKELKDLNEEISAAITEIEAANDSRLFPIIEEQITDTIDGNSTAEESEDASRGASHFNLRIENCEDGRVGDGSSLKKKSESKRSSRSKRVATKRTIDNAGKLAVEPIRKMTNVVGDVADEDVLEFAKLPLSGMREVAGAAKGLLFAEDGEPTHSAFVTFKSLRSTQTALQMLHHSEPYAMEVIEAPSPDDVFWENVGKTHHELEAGRTTSFVASAALCLVWTVPMSFVSSLSNVKSLRLEVDFLDDLLNVIPSLESILQILSPLLILALNEILKIILERLSMYEGPVSGAIVQASLFKKLAVFMIIHVFFVTALSGGLFTALSAVLDDPFGKGIEVLATSLPTKSTIFLQLLVADTCVNVGAEVLRVKPLALAFLRSFFGPRLTEKERSTTWFGLRPLSDPIEFEHADVLSQCVLYFMVLFVYAAIAPLVTVFLTGFFYILKVCYRHQFIYIYPTLPDSGGQLWTKLVTGIVPVCMIIAQITIIGLFILKEAPIEAGLMIPLIFITFAFQSYINKKHSRLTQFLPGREALKADLAKESDISTGYEFVKGKYIQPELLNKDLQPENSTVEREINQGGVMYETPVNSQREENDEP